MVNTYFLDTSALVKRYVPETGSNWIQSITDVAVNNDGSPELAVIFLSN